MVRQSFMVTGACARDYSPHGGQEAEREGIRTGSGQDTASRDQLGPTTAFHHFLIMTSIVNESRE
jgi:hypothetical protein